MAALLGRLVVSLGVVVGLMILAGRMMGGRARTGGRRPGAVQVVTRQPLGRNASVTVVRTGGRTLVLGVTEQSINVLAEVDAAEFEPDPAVQAGPRPTPRPTLLDLLRERTVRR